MKNAEILFNAKEFLTAVKDLQGYVPGKRKVTVRTIEVALPAPAPEISPEEIVATRKALRVSQSVFARILNVPTITEVSWEKGRRKPSGAALRLLQIARKYPKTLLKV